ncbi:nucleotidyl transferase AbiEii/AbiGii toxin family protein [Nocardioides sp.]|uniref:nucleotidyl transferase AbiEii/AbiGii toxin family protein n=1 Tax=Nocardioides sp. TaxID=35761 RepID=UPI0026358B20|nr:nucleotidyl transferase AbiEii/AbiGii toxin family protein [Nocardioides sp.]
MTPNAGSPRKRRRSFAATGSIPPLGKSRSQPSTRAGYLAKSGCPRPKVRGRSLGELRREFLFQRFLALIFSTPNGQWVLKGGAGLLMRLAEARFSKDLDLLHLGEVTPDQAIAELRSLTAARDGDHLTFIVENGVAYSRTNPVVEISVTAYIGARYDSFPIDLARELHLLAAPERIRPTPVVHVPGLTELPEVVVYPLSDQVADKVCAMFELYGERANPSSRYRDLIDLALIVSTCDLDAVPVSQALLSESKRRVMKLPEQMVSPGPQWPSGYAAYARKTKIDESLHALEAAIEHVGRCVNPLLSGARSTGRWHPGVGWSD